jgi:peptidoglycan hydrolase FlgJ
MTGAPAAYSAAATAFQAGQTVVPRKGPDEAATRKAAEEFEALFLSQMLESMFKDVPTGGLTGGGPGEQIWRSMMLQEYGKTLASSGGIGIADMVTRELMRLQEAG